VARFAGAHDAGIVTGEEVVVEPNIKHKIDICARADDAEWTELISRVGTLGAAQKGFLREHPPGLVRALWTHFAATRGRCGCRTASHERPECTVGLIERLLLDGEIA
jgi:hypothetical protein